MEILDDDFRKINEDEAQLISQLKADAFMQVKPIKNARITLYVVAALTAIGILLLSFQLDSEIDKFTFFAIGLSSALAFLILGLLVPKNPKVVLIIGLSVYGLLKLVDMVGGANPLSGILGIILIGYFLVKGIQASIKFEEARKELQKLGHDFQLNDEI